MGEFAGYCLARKPGVGPRQLKGFAFLLMESNCLISFEICEIIVGCYFGIPLLDTMVVELVPERLLRSGDGPAYYIFNSVFSAYDDIHPIASCRRHCKRYRI